MAFTAKVDQQGRLRLPAAWLRRHGICAGQTVSLEVEPPAAAKIESEPELPSRFLIRDGDWILHVGEPTGDLTRVIDEMREHRIRDLIGPWG